MKRRRMMRFWVAGVMILTLSLISVLSAVSQPAGPGLKLILIDGLSRSEIKQLARMGLDIASVREGPVAEGPRGILMQTYSVEVVVSSIDAAKLGSQGFSWSEVPGKGPQKKIGEPYEVYHSFDEPINGIKDELRKIAATYPHIAQLKTIGKSIQNRPMLAMRLTNEKVGKKTGKPQVLFLATHHAREWVATQMGMRLIKYLTANYGSEARVTNLLDSVEVWVIPVANPDGYQYTFTNERLWRKNLRDNNGDGQITIADGVDLNRNFSNHWGLDNEGSSPVWSSGTYRGTAPNSEPETQAVVDFIQSKDFKFVLSYHTSGNLILYPWGWQVKTPSLDDPIFLAQAGTDDNPAIWDTTVDPPVPYDPGVGADLYITNGDFTDWTYGALGIPSHTVELTDGYDFRFPDDEGMLQNVFDDNKEFALSLAESALDPAHPVSPVGITTEDAYHTPVTASYGSSQTIEVLARKGLPLALSYSINGGASQTAGFAEQLGEFYNQNPGTYYSRYVALISGQGAGDSVEYKITAGGASLGPYSYSVASATGNPILLVAAEDYTGINPTYPPGGPFYLSYYMAALDAGGYAYDVWDVDQQGIPSYAEVLSHYEVVMWYTGDDFIARVPLNLATQEAEVLNFRDFLNFASGKLFASGQDLAWLATAGGYYADDFFQYYLGAFIDQDTGGIDATTHDPYDVEGASGDLFDGMSFALQGGDGADNQCCSSTFLVTSYFLPHFDSTLTARYFRPGGPFDPHSGTYYQYSQLADLSFKRLGGTFTIPASSPYLKFWISYDIETDWDFAFVEINEVGTDSWTTLADVNGLTTDNTGDSCQSGWVDEIHPFLAHYMDAGCNPSGSTGSWNGFTGNSGGWQQVEMDLSAYAGKTVELHISYATDWSVQNLGVFVDDIELSGYPLEDFEAGSGSWSTSVPAGSTAFNNWVRITGAGIPEGPAIRTPYSVYLGFGLEAIDNATDRAAVMDKVMEYLGQ